MCLLIVVKEGMVESLNDRPDLWFTALILIKMLRCGNYLLINDMISNSHNLNFGRLALGQSLDSELSALIFSPPQSAAFHQG